MILKKTLLTLSVLTIIAQPLSAQTPINVTTKGISKTTDRMIIKYKDNKTLTDATITSTLKNITLSGNKQIQVGIIRKNALHANILKVTVDGKKPSLQEMEELAKKLSTQSDIEYAEPDYIRRIMQVPNDTFYPTKHWHYQDTPGGANLEGAWDITTGSTSDVIAVIDTGILNHTELVGKIVPGYDFISDTSVSNDGDGRDSDPSDPGDNTDPNAQYGSSWHGTHVAGTIGAASNNNDGITGINWNGKILPIRVLGVGGGYTSDIVDGMLWAAGLSVTGITDNPNPAKVLNLSLGGYGSCTSSEQDAIDAINAIGAIIVIAAGNDDADASNYSPGNCNDVITVAASARDGGRAYYSNYGNSIDITAPGGDENEDSEVYSTVDGGFTIPVNDDSYASYQGTSMATPHIAGIVSLMTSLQPSFSYSEALTLLEQTAKAFPTGTGNDCTTSLCGAGIVDATALLTVVSNPDALAPKYNDMLNEKRTSLYDFSEPSHHMDPNSLWTIINGRLTSNDINDDEATSYAVTMAGTLFDVSFHYNVSAEADYDGLRFEIEGSTVFNDLSGNFSGNHETKKIATDGTLNLNWTYHKDFSVSAGNDNASIDNLSISSYTPTSYNFVQNGSSKKILTISNSGIHDLIVTNVSLSNANDFSLTNGCMQALKGDESCQIEIDYLSPYNPSHTTTLTFSTNDSDHQAVSKLFNVGSMGIIPVITYLLQ
ncbi:MAG: S8 family serine peptidase [Campylobacterota bacterium]|nr:S8 family serine peptidase [Campylobacterota bacterium]